MIDAETAARAVLAGTATTLPKSRYGIVESLRAITVTRASPVKACTAARLMTTASDNPERLHFEAAFAMLCGAAPLPASSGRTDRHRLNRAG